jgi:hypothetical protein
MSRRNVWLKFSEWELINEELSDQKYHSFQLSPKQVKEWKNDMKKFSYTEDRKFERVGIYPEVDWVKSARAVNILCRENWRSEDLHFNLMRSLHSFIGFIVTYCDDVNMDTTREEWEQIRKHMKDLMDKSEQRFWHPDEIIRLYNDSILSLNK